MSEGIDIEGLDELINFFDNITIDEVDVKKAIRKGIKPIAKSIEKNTPSRTGKLAKVKTTIKNDGFDVKGIVNSKQFYDIFQEFGTSQQKKNIGYFERSVKDSENEAIKILADELLKFK